MTDYITIDAETIEDLDPDARTATLIQFMQEIYGESWKRPFATETGMNPRTLDNWTTNGKTPTWAIIYAQQRLEILNVREKERKIADFFKLAAEIAGE